MTHQPPGGPRAASADRHWVQVGPVCAGTVLVWGKTLLTRVGPY